MSAYSIAVWVLHLMQAHLFKWYNYTALREPIKPQMLLLALGVTSALVSNNTRGSAGVRWGLSAQPGPNHATSIFREGIC